MSWKLAGAAAIALVLAVYAYRVGDVPAYVGLDEAHFANHAHSLATTGRDLNGNRLPLFISLEDPLGDRPVLPWGTTWYHPVGFYLIASALTVTPLSEWAIRLPIVLIGVLDIVLIYLVAYRWYGDRWTAVGAAALLAMSPAHFLLSRLALDYLLPLPFALAWLLSLTTLMRRADRRSAMVTGLILGAGCYSYVSSWLMMPLYLAITMTVLIASLRRRDLLAPLLAGFVVPLLLLAPWLLLHPSMPGNVVAQYQAGETRRSILTALVTWTSVSSAVRDALSAYWSYFNPSFLFVTGGSGRLASTGSIGVWPFGMAVLLVLGLMRVMRMTPAASGAILLAGLLLSPLPAALKGEPFAVQRAVGLLPFGALVAAGALTVFRGQRPQWEKAAVVLALIAMPLQFSGFLRNYFDGYSLEASRALDPTAFRETADLLLSDDLAAGAPVIALTAPLYDVSAKWRFYCTKAGRVDLLNRTRYFSGRLDEISDLAAGSLAIVETAQGTDAPGWTRVAVPQSVFGETPLTVFRRQ
jgi:4-amino-4-deoxy-L-arabinose transferase-like glycosyltransferase